MSKRVTKRVSEEKRINWFIVNFGEIVETQCHKNASTILEFSAGESFNQPSNWELGLKFTTLKDIKLYLHLKQSYKSSKSVYAQHWVSIRDPISTHVVHHRSATSVTEYTTNNGGWSWDFAIFEKLPIPGTLLNESLIIQVKIIVYGNYGMFKRLTPARNHKMVIQNELSLMSNDFEYLLRTGECSDFLIRVKDLDSGEWDVEKKVHRMILSSQSPVFKAMMGSPMSEKETGVVTIEDLSPKGLDILLEFIYTGILPNAWTLVPEEIINAAEKYNFPLLKTYVDKSLHTAATRENAIILFNLAKQHNLYKAFKNIATYIKSNLETVLIRV